jgi:hypothetical protein
VDRYNAPIRGRTRRKQASTAYLDVRLAETEPSDVILPSRTSSPAVPSRTSIPKEPDLILAPSPASVWRLSHVPSLSSIHPGEFSMESVRVTLFHSSPDRIPLDWEFRVHATTVSKVICLQNNC